MTSTPAPSLRLRALTVDDLDAMGHLELKAHPLPWSLSQLHAELVHEDAFVVGAFVDDDRAASVGERLVGHMVLRRMVDELWILNVCSDPQRRRQGIGALLMQKALETAQATSTSLWLEVRESNAAARALYEKCGLVVVGRRPGYYRPAPPQTTPEAAILMRKA